MILAALHRAGVDIRPEAMGDQLGRRRDGDATPRLVRPLRGPVYTIADARPVTDDIVDQVRDRVHATFGAWEPIAPGARRRRVSSMQENAGGSQACALGGDRSPRCSYSRPARSAAAPARYGHPRSPPSTATGRAGRASTAAASGTAVRRQAQRPRRSRHEARRHRQQGHDRRRDQGRHRGGGRPDRRQLDLHGDRRARQPVPEVRQGRRTASTSSSTYVGSQSPSEYLTKLAAAKQSGSDDAVRRHRGRGELLGRRRSTRASSTDFLPSDLVPNENLLLPRLPARPDRPRLPGARRSSRSSTTRRTQPVDQELHGPRRPAPQGQGHRPAAR